MNFRDKWKIWKLFQIFSAGAYALIHGILATEERWVCDHAHYSINTYNTEVQEHSNMFELERCVDLPQLSTKQSADLSYALRHSKFLTDQKILTMYSVDLRWRKVVGDRKDCNCWKQKNGKIGRMPDQ